MSHDELRTFVLATNNKDKAEEIIEILRRSFDDDVSLILRPPEIPEVEESADSLLGNARLKAAAISQATGLAAISDDTGLEVIALNGAPGVYSARFAGVGATYRDNCLKLLEELRSIDDRRAQFRTVALAHFVDDSELFAEGVVYGTIATSGCGQGGFGYDELFVPDEGDGRTFAEMSSDEKSRISHRGRAFRALACKIETAIHATRTVP